MQQRSPQPDETHRAQTKIMRTHQAVAGGVGGDEGRVVDQVEQRRLQQLRHRQRALHLDERLPGEAGRAVPQRVHLHLGAVQRAQPLEEGRLRVRDLPAGWMEWVGRVGCGGVGQGFLAVKWSGRGLIGWDARERSAPEVVELIGREAEGGQVLEHLDTGLLII